MDKINKMIAVVIAGALSVAMLATMTGSLLWLMWEHTVPYFFPMWIKAGVPSQPGWWECVLLVWVTTILLKVKASAVTKD